MMCSANKTCIEILMHFVLKMKLMVSGQCGQTGRDAIIPVVEEPQLVPATVQILSHNMVGIHVMDQIMNLPSAQRTKASQTVTTHVY